MAHAREMKFGDLQMDERYKKLKRTLKLAILKKRNINFLSSGYTSPTPTWPSVSSINGDPLDSSHTASSLQVSRIGSEVVSSSKNLRNVLLKKKGIPPHIELMTTSSIKQQSTNQQDSTDNLMKPPSFNVVPRSINQAKREMSLDNTGTVLAERSPLFLNNKSSNSTHNCTFTNVNTNTEYQNKTVPLETGTNNFRKKVVRVFYKWRVMLNQQGQLVIKGTIDSGHIAHSKPVIRRLTATSVESIFKHTYQLQGYIHDERNELPDYIRGKFYNGFPDDWENVYQVWRTFIAQGSPVTFRWPTPITDSDDDIISEVTDLTLLCLKNDKPLLKQSESYKDSQNKSGSLCISQNKKDKCRCCCPRTVIVNNSFTQTSDTECKNDRTVISKNDTSDAENSTAYRIMHNINVPIKANKLRDIIQQDEIDIIINNLADKNCSQEYIDKIIEMFDCLNYVVSYRSTAGKNSETELNLNSNTNVSQSRSRIDDTISSLGKRSTSETIPLQKDVTFQKYNQQNFCHEQLGHKSNVTTAESSDNSENEMYAGVPKISLERVLRSKDTTKPYKRKMRKRKTPYGESNSPEIKTQLVEEMENIERKIHQHNSSISIVEDEVESCRNKNHIGQDIQKCSVKLMDIGACKKTKPTVISSVPISANIKMIDKAQKSYNSDSDISENEDPNLISKTVLKEDNYEVPKEKIISIKTNDKAFPSNSTAENANQDSMSNTKTESKINSTTSGKSVMNESKSSKSSKNDKSRNESKPKQLTSWVPNVVYTSESNPEKGLIFEGKLLNDAGHVVHRKYITAVILRRLSPTLIETVDQEVYELVGHMNDTKHVVPKELLKYCRNGCPLRVKEFCKMWNTLRKDNVDTLTEKCHNISMDILDVPISSRGRRILPPLNYWTGERIALRDNNLIYSPGVSEESFILSPKKRVDENQKSLVKNISKSEKKVNKESVKKSVNAKRRTAQQLQFTSSDSDDKDAPVLKTAEATNQLKVQMRNSSKNNSRNHRTGHESAKPGYNEQSKKRARMDTKSSVTLHSDTLNLKYTENRLPAGKTQHICTYYHGIPAKNDLLSDDQLSQV